MLGLLDSQVNLKKTLEYIGASKKNDVQNVPRLDHGILLNKLDDFWHY